MKNLIRKILKESDFDWMDEIKPQNFFPDDFEHKNHRVVPGASQWTLSNNEGDIVISVVGGGVGLYGDGIETFEMFDFRESEPQGYLSTEEINQHLKNNPI